MERIGQKREDKNSLFISIYLTSTCISSIISAFIAVPLISVLLVCLVMVLVFYYNKHIKISKYHVFYFIFFTILITLSFLLNGTSESLDYFTHFLVFGFSSLLISNIKISGYKTTVYILLVYALFCIIYFLRIQHITTDETNNQMGLAYTLVPGVLVGYSVFRNRCCYNRKIKLLSLLTILSSIWIILFKTVTRGAILAVIIGVFFIYYVGTNPNNRKRVIFCFMIIIPLIVYFVVIALSSIETSSIGAINKLMIMAEAGDASNGRFDLWKSAITIISENPLFGHGVGYFEKNNASAYPHQFFLQILSEFGFIGSIIILIPLFYKFRCLLKVRVTQSAILFSIYFVYSLVMLTFSNSYWLFPTFWFLFFNRSLLDCNINKK